MVENWEFTGERWPDVLELGELRRELPPHLACTGNLDNLYEAYQELHPEFRRYAEIPGMRRQWRRAMIFGVDPMRDSMNICNYAALRSRFYANPFGMVRLYVPECPARMAQMPERKREAQELANEMLEYALGGSIYMSQNLLSGIGRIRVHPRLRYYIQRQLKARLPEYGITEENDEAPIPEAGEDLAPEVREFIDAARERGDYTAVLDSIDVCAPRNKFVPAPPPKPEDI